MTPAATNLLREFIEARQGERRLHAAHKRDSANDSWIRFRKQELRTNGIARKLASELAKVDARPLTGRCATCRHWTRNRWEIRNAAGEFVVDSSELKNRFGRCAILAREEQYDLPATDRVIYPHVHHGEQLSTIETGEAFGCVHWMVLA